MTSPAKSTISGERFASAQQAEFDRWNGNAQDDEAVRAELSEHSEIAEPLRQVAGDRLFDRGLEVGIGPFGLGFLPVHFFDRVGQIDGLDPLPQLEVRVADTDLQSRVADIRSRVRFIQAKAEVIPVASACYDIVSCINVVDHAQSPGKIIQEIHRVLRPGGLLVFGVSTLSSAGEALWNIRRRFQPSAFLFAAHPHTFQWRRANELVARLPGVTLWQDRPGWAARGFGHGRMSFWIREKARA